MRPQHLRSLALMILSVTLSCGFSVELRANPGAKIAKKAYNLGRGYKGSYSELVLSTREKNGRIETRKMQIMEKELGVGQYTLITLTEPADVKNVKLLSNVSAKSYSQHIFFPSSKKAQKLIGNTRFGTFFGSEFTYEDVMKKTFDAFRYRKLGEATVSKKKVVKIEKVPTKKSDSQYSKEHVYIDRNHRPVKVEYFNRSGSMVKRAVIEGYKKYPGGVTMPQQIKIENLKNGRKSILRWQKRTTNKDYGGEMFTVQALEADF